MVLTLVICILGSLREEDCHKFEVILSYIVSSRLALAKERDPVSKKMAFTNLQKYNNSSHVMITQEPLSMS